jgi:SAM-dependent methyltransferase
VNRNAWSAFARQGQPGTTPPEAWAFEQPRRWLDEYGWLPWERLESVLCLASGGGAQGPLFASLGMTVTVGDISPDQLLADRLVANEHGLEVETVEVDMQDLSPLYGREYDLVYQPISSLYVPDIRVVYREVMKVTRRGGLYMAEHWNPVQMQISDQRPWEDGAYRLVHRQGDGAIAWSHPAPDGSEAVTWNYIHSLSALIGGLCDAGFVILRLAERGHGDRAAPPGSEEHLATFLPSFVSTLATAPDR